MSDRFDDVMGSLSRIRAGIADVLAAHGLVLDGFVIAPDESSDGTHEIQITASLGEAGPATDDTFDEIISANRQHEIDELAARNRASLETDFTDWFGNESNPTTGQQHAKQRNHNRREVPGPDVG